MKFSIVTITYNNLTGLKSTAESLLAQSFTDYEWIVVDGGSTDGTREYLTALERKPDWWCSEGDGGIFDAQNKGTGHVNGEYVNYMNAGDVFASEDILWEVAKGELTGDVVYGNCIFLTADGTKSRFEYPDNFTDWYFLDDNVTLCHQAVFIKRDLAKAWPYDTKYKLASDWMLWRQLYYTEHSFQHINIYVCMYSLDGLSQKNRQLLEKEKELAYEDLQDTIVAYYENRVRGGYKELMFERARYKMKAAKDKACAYGILKQYLGTRPPLNKATGMIIKFLWHKVLLNK